MTTPPIFAIFNFWRNATFTAQFVVNDGSGAPEDLTGWTATATITRENDSTPLYTLSTEDSPPGIAPLDATGAVSLSIQSPQAGILVDTGVAVDADGEIWPLVVELTDPAADPGYSRRLAQGYVVASA